MLFTNTVKAWTRQLYMSNCVLCYELTQESTLSRRWTNPRGSRSWHMRTTCCIVIHITILWHNSRSLSTWWQKLLLELDFSLLQRRHKPMWFIRSTPNTKMHMGGSDIEWVKQFNYLGVVIGCKLRLHRQAECITNRVSKAANALMTQFRSIDN